MIDFYDPITDEMQPITEGLEQAGAESLEDAVNTLKASSDLIADEESWLEHLVHHMVNPVGDVIEHLTVGVDSETISPIEGVSEQAIEEYDLNDAAEEWHMQDGNYSCAVCCQQFIINEFLDLDVTEEELCEVAEQNGWFDPESGTSLENVDNLLELYGIDTQMNESGTIEDIAETLDQGGRVIVGVDGMVLWTDGAYNYPWSGADHAIEVIGIDDSDPSDIKVIINDSGIEDGCGKAVPLSEFQEAWDLSGGFMVSAFPND